MNIEEIRELIQCVVDSGVAELEVQRGEDRVKIRRGPTEQEVLIHTAAAPAPVVVQAAPAAAPAPAPAPAAPPPISASEDELVPIKSPIVGTFYSSASPDTPLFVNVGDSIKPGMVLCIVESMKLMNEIEAEVSGTIIKCLVENGNPVEYGQAMFLIKPH